MTEYVSTRWYRSPEVLLGSGNYSHQMDIWAIGCVMFELLGLRPLFPGDTQKEVLTRIHNILGSPTSELYTKLKGESGTPIGVKFPHREGKGLRKMLPDASFTAMNLLRIYIYIYTILDGLLSYDPELRLTAKEALNHEFFNELKAVQIAPFKEVQYLNHFNSHFSMASLGIPVLGEPENGTKNKFAPLDRPASIFPPVYADRRAQLPYDDKRTTSL